MTKSEGGSETKVRMLVRIAEIDADLVGDTDLRRDQAWQWRTQPQHTPVEIHFQRAVPKSPAIGGFAMTSVSDSRLPVVPWAGVRYFRESIKESGHG